MGHTVKRCPKVQSGGDTNGAGDSGPAARSTWDNEDKPVDGGWGEGDATNQESQAADGDDGGWGTGGGGGW